MILKLKRLLSAVCFCLVVLIVMSSLSALQHDDCWSDWVNEDPYPYQVLWLGSSHIYRCIIPQLLYNDYGLETLSASTPRQTCAYSLSILEDLPNLDQYKLIVLDIYAFLRPYTYDDYFNHTLRTTQLSSASEEMRTKHAFYSAAPIRQLLETNPKKYLRIMGEKEQDVPSQYYSSLFLSHSQYLRMNRSNYERLNSSLSRNKNYDLGLWVFPQNNPFEKELPENSDVRLNEQCEAYLMDIIKLCKSKGVPLLLTALPYHISTNARIVMEQIAQIAEKNDVDFLSMETICEESWIEWAEDFGDAGHTNHYGATKVTDFFGWYLTDTYALEDRSIQPSPDSPFLHNPDGYQITETLLNFTSQPSTLRNTLESLYDFGDQFLLLFTSGKNHGLDLDADILDILRNLAIDIPVEIPKEGFTLMHIGTPNGVLAQSTDPDADLYFNIDQAPFKLSVTQNSICINHQPFVTDALGSRLVLYDLASHETIGCISLDCKADDIVPRLQ